MSQCKLTKNKPKMLVHNIPSIDLLFRGYQRKLSQNEYIKSFPKLRLNMNSKGHALASSKCQSKEQVFGRQMLSLKEQNVRLQVCNAELLVGIKKQQKMNEIYSKRMEHKSIQEIPFEKILQIKLLMEVQQLQQQLKRTEEELINLTRLTKSKKQLINYIDLQPNISLHSIILNSNSIHHFKQATSANLDNTNEALDLMAKKKLRLRHYHKKVMEELKALRVEIQREKAVICHIPNKIEDNQGGAQTNPSRNKSIEELEVEIEKIVKEGKDYQVTIQAQMDKHITEKILLMNQIQQIRRGKDEQERNNTSSSNLLW